MRFEKNSNISVYVEKVAVACIDFHKAGRGMPVNNTRTHTFTTRGGRPGIIRMEGGMGSGQKFTPYLRH